MKGLRRKTRIDPPHDYKSLWLRSRDPKFIITARVSPDQPSSPPDKAEVASLVKWGKEVTRPVHTQTIDGAWAREQYEAQSNNRVFDHELVPV
jgi:hypothetical protein